MTSGGHAAGVISEVDAAVRGLLEREVSTRSGVDVVFEAPTKDWASRRSAPTVDVYLYDIREDLKRRSRGLVNAYDDDGHVVGRTLPPRHFTLSYLVTAWTQRPEDEHRLLSDMLGAFLRYEALPRELLTGSLADLGLPVPVTVALPPPEDRSFADVWSALGGELKPSLDVVVSAPLDSGQRVRTGPPTLEAPVLVVGGTPPDAGAARFPEQETRRGRRRRGPR